jgi:hypothetical protein
MNLTFELEHFWINEDDGKSVLCEIDLFLASLPTPDIRASLNDPGEPGEPAVFEIQEIRLIECPDAPPDVHGHNWSGRGQILTLTETQFELFFDLGQDVMNSAYEWASEQEIEYV